MGTIFVLIFLVLQMLNYWFRFLVYGWRSNFQLMALHRMTQSPAFVAGQCLIVVDVRDKQKRKE